MKHEEIGINLISSGYYRSASHPNSFFLKDASESRVNFAVSLGYKCVVFSGIKNNAQRTIRKKMANNSTLSPLDIDTAEKRILQAFSLPENPVLAFPDFVVINPLFLSGDTYLRQHPSIS